MTRLLLALVVLASPAARLSIQVMTAKPAGEVLHITAPGFTFLEGAVLERLRDGRSARLDFELTVLARPRGSALARDKRSFNVSLDLWEERFSVSKIGTPARSVSHLRAPDAEAWCLENLTVPLSAFARHVRDVPFWVRLEYQVPDLDAASEQNAEGFTLRSLIDRLSKRPQNLDPGKSLDGGPFQLK